MAAAGEDAPNPIKVVIIDDHAVVALGLKALLNDSPSIEVVGVAHGVAEGVTAVRRHQPRVVLVDYRLGDGTGAEAARLIRQGTSPPALVMITAAADRRVLGEALDAGCAGFVSKNAEQADLVAAITAAANNDSYFTRDVLKHLVHLRRFEQVDNEELSDREVEVLQLSADGLSPEQIGAQLFLSVHTVKNHLRHAMGKLGAHTKLEAVVKAIRARLISIA
jgi:DNA-binding NarL/FixJ family response regulator